MSYQANWSFVSKDGTEQARFTRKAARRLLKFGCLLRAVFIRRRRILKLNSKLNFHIKHELHFLPEAKQQ